MPLVLTSLTSSGEALSTVRLLLLSGIANNSAAPLWPLLSAILLRRARAAVRGARSASYARQKASLLGVNPTTSSNCIRTVGRPSAEVSDHTRSVQDTDPSEELHTVPVAVFAYM